MNPRQSIVSFMRGLFICPIIAFLLKNNLTKVFFKKKFSLSDFKTIKNKEFFYNILLYLQNLGLIKSINRTKKNFKTTELGKKILLRSGSFLILHSYKSFIDNLDKTLFKNQVLDNKCDRKENIIGSGSIHKKKFFPKAFSLIKSKDVGLIVDIGCGDGNFLIEARVKKMNHELLGEYIIAEVTLNILNYDQEKILSNLRRFCLNNMTKYKVPSKFKIMDWKYQII